MESKKLALRTLIRALPKEPLPELDEMTEYIVALAKDVLEYDLTELAQLASALAAVQKDSPVDNKAQQDLKMQELARSQEHFDLLRPIFQKVQELGSKSSPAASPSNDAAAPYFIEHCKRQLLLTCNACNCCEGEIFLLPDQLVDIWNNGRDKEDRESFHCAPAKDLRIGVSHVLRDQVGNVLKVIGMNEEEHSDLLLLSTEKSFIVVPKDAPVQVNELPKDHRQPQVRKMQACKLQKGNKTRMSTGYEPLLDITPLPGPMKVIRVRFGKEDRILYCLKAKGPEVMKIGTRSLFSGKNFADMDLQFDKDRPYELTVAAKYAKMFYDLASQGLSEGVRLYYREA